MGKPDSTDDKTPDKGKSEITDLSHARRLASMRGGYATGSSGVSTFRNLADISAQNEERNQRENR